MIHSKATLEEAFTAELRRVETPYRRALALITAALPGDDPQPGEVELCLSQLQPLMQQVQASETRLAPLRQAWLALEEKPGAELQQVLQLHEELLGGLINRIDQVERALQHKRQTLTPSVDSYVRHQQMQKAYHMPR